MKVFSSAFQKILTVRGFQDYELFSSDPTSFHMDSIPEVDHAKNIFKHFVNKKSKICIAADYDCDGITSAAQLVLYLQSQNISPIVLFPNRFTEGYGLNLRIVNYAIKNHFELLICLDFGSTNIDLIQFAEDNNLTVLVLDHHKIDQVVKLNKGQILNSYCMQEPFKQLCTSGLTFFFLKSFIKDELISEYIELATLGTLADMVPLRFINRVLVKKGLELFKSCSNLGIKILAEKNGLSEISQQALTFTLAPQINAGGRLGYPQQSLNLLVSKDPNLVSQIADSLIQANLERRKKQELGIELAKKKIINQSSSVAIYDPSIDLGVIGLVAQKLVESLKIPAAVASQDHTGVIKGSARVPKGYDCFQALKACEQLMSKFGGHQSAGGFSLKPDVSFEEFMAFWNSYFLNKQPNPIQSFDLEITPTEITFDFLDEINLLKPFGIGNNEPKFLLKGCQIVSKSRYGNQGFINFNNSIYEFVKSKDLTDPIPNTQFDCVCSLRAPLELGLRRVILVLKEVSASSP